MSYPGSKAGNGVWQRIIGQMPPHHTFIEAFYGSGVISRLKRPADINVAVDKLKRVLPKPSGGMFAALGVGPSEPFVQPVHACFLDWGKRVLLGGPDDCASTMVYCDPPYPLDSRQGRLYYENELSDAQHLELLDLLKSLKGYVLLSGVECPLYRQHIPGNWRCVRYRTRWHRKTVTECLWCNFPEPDQLHDWRYAGQNYRQRLYLGRMRKRTLAKFDAMKPKQRNFLLDVIYQRYFRREDPNTHGILAPESGA